MRLVSFSAGHGVVSIALIAGFCFLVVLLFLLLHIPFGFAADVVLMAASSFFPGCLLHYIYNLRSRGPCRATASRRH